MEKIPYIGKANLKYICSLQKRKYRNQYKEFLVEGIHLLEEVLRSSIQISMVLATLPFLKEERGHMMIMELIERKIPLFLVQESSFKSLTDTVTPQGILAIAKIPKEADWRRWGKRILVLDRIQDPGNLGTIIRTATAVACDGLILLKGTVDPYSPKVVRGAMGTLFHQPLSFNQEKEEVMEYLRAKGFMVVAAHSKGEPFYSIIFREPVALVVGSESRGVDPFFLEKADAIAAVPLEKGVESLNVSMATGIILYEIYRQR